MSEKINSKLRDARRRNFWTIKYAARKVGVTPLTYNRWELGMQTPHLSSLQMLCEVFRAMPKDLGL